MRGMAWQRFLGRDFRLPRRAARQPSRTCGNEARVRGNDVELERVRPGSRLETLLAGVTFDGRQSVVRNVEVGQKVLLERERDNLKDPNAVAALTLGGDHLGYIKAKFNRCFEYDSTFGTVTGAGFSERANSYYARVACEPATPPLTLDLPPIFASVHELTGPDFFDRVCSERIAKAAGACETCRKPHGSQPQCQEVWAIDPTERTQTLRGVICLCSSCAQVRKLRHRQHLGTDEVDEIPDWWKGHFCHVTGLTESEAAAYMERAFRLWRRYRTDPEWRVDVSSFLNDPHQLS